MSDTKKLYKNFVTKLNKVIEEGETVVIGEGEDAKTIHKEASAAFFSVARQFLKDIGENGVDSKSSIADKMKALSLPFTQSGEDRAPH